MIFLLFYIIVSYFDSTNSYYSSIVKRAPTPQFSLPSGFGGFGGYPGFGGIISILIFNGI